MPDNMLRKNIFMTKKTQINFSLFLSLIHFFIMQYDQNKKQCNWTKNHSDKSKQKLMKVHLKHKIECKFDKNINQKILKISSKRKQKNVFH